MMCMPPNVLVADLNEVLSVKAQEFVPQPICDWNSFDLNEVLSVKAQE